MVPFFLPINKYGMCEPQILDNKLRKIIDIDLNID
jgi:hypothetical protein